MNWHGFLRVAAALVLVVFVSGFASKKKASSAIPEKRDFPVNQSLSPCQNFFNYACSEAISGFELREDRSRHIFSFSDSHERVLEAKKKFLLSLPEKKELSPRAQTLSHVFQACMNEKSSAAEEKERVGQLLSEVASIQTHEEFQKFLFHKMQNAEFSFVDWGATSNLDDSDWDDVYFLADLQTLPEKTYYEKPEVLADLQALAQAMFEAAGLHGAPERAKAVVAFEKEFSKSYPAPAEMRELFNTKSSTTREKVLKEYPAFQMAGFFEKLPKRTRLKNLTPQNYAWVNQALTREPLETLKNVYLFRALPAYMDDAYPEYFKQAFEFNKKHLGGPNVRPVRQERCTMYVMDHFTKEIDAELLPIFFPSFPEEKLIALVEKVRASIIRGIETNQWLSPQSKKAAVNKIRVARLQLVKPRNDKEWDFTPPAQYSPDRRYANNHLLEKNLQEKTLRELAQKRDRNRWEMGPLTVNAYYSPSDNKFVLPIGILQYPFYDPQLPDSTNLGAVGMVVGHELGHGVDDHGARYDATGRMIQWMSKKDLKEFEKRGQRLVAQFDKAGHNGKLTLGENIGDLVGITFAYQAAFPADKGTLKEKQDFFLQYARTWCGVVRPKMREMLLKTDPHSAIDARVNEQVKHQPGFEQAFACKAGDPMILPQKDRVQIW